MGMIEDYERHLKTLECRKLIRQNKSRSAQRDTDKTGIDDIAAAFQTSNRRFFSKSMAIALIITGIFFACLYAIVISTKHPAKTTPKPKQAAITTETKRRVVAQRDVTKNKVMAPVTQPLKMPITDTASRVPVKPPTVIATQNGADVDTADAKSPDYDKRKGLEEAKHLMRKEIARKSEALHRDKIAGDEAVKAEIDRVSKLRKERRNTEERTRGHIIYLTDE